MSSRFASFCLSAALVLLSSAAMAETTGYALKETVPLPGPVRWDYLTLDSAQHHLFLTRGDRVDVYDLASKKIINSIENLEGVHGVALVPDIGKGFLSEGKANRVTLFDLQTFQPTATVPTGNKPDAIIYDPQTRRVFVADGESNDVTVIDADKSVGIGSIKLDGAPEFMALDGDGKLYVNLEDLSAIDVVDTHKLKVTKRYNLASACDAPTGLAFSKADHSLFSVCANRHMVVTDARTGTIKDTLAIGEHPDAAVFDPATNLVFSSNGDDGTLTVAGKTADGHYKVVQTVLTKISARTMALDPSTHDIYLSAAETEGFEPAASPQAKPRLHIKPDSFMLLRVGE